MGVWFFFFSSRRRHTRYWRDWSSDVCSSDLIDLHQRAHIANKANADLFVSVHTNSLPPGRVARGFQTYTLGMHRAKDNLDVAMRENSRSEEHTSELQSRQYLVCRLLLEKKKIYTCRGY